MSSPDIQVTQYELQIDMAASPERVWKALTEETQAWWLPDFHVVEPDSVMSFEARPGGQLTETRPDGTGLLWYTVQMVTPQKDLRMVGHVFPGWGGPSISMLTLELEERGSGTVLKVSDSILGTADDKRAEMLRAGWEQLFTSLATHAAR